MKRCGFYFCHRSAGIQEADIFVDTVHSQLDLKNSHALPARAPSLVMLLSVSVALSPATRERGKVGGPIASRFF